MTYCNDDGNDMGLIFNDEWGKYQPAWEKNMNKNIIKNVN